MRDEFITWKQAKNRLKTQTCTTVKYNKFSDTFTLVDGRIYKNNLRFDEPLYPKEIFCVVD